MAHSRPRRPAGAQAQASRRRLRFRLLVAGIVLFCIAWGVGIAIASQSGTEEGRRKRRQPGRCRSGCRRGRRCKKHWSSGQRAVRLASRLRRRRVRVGHLRRLLIGYSENVFAARVTERVGTEAAETSIPGDDETPHTQYVVEVLGVVKSEGSKTVCPPGTGLP